MPDPVRVSPSVDVEAAAEVERPGARVRLGLAASVLEVAAEAEA